MRIKEISHLLRRIQVTGLQIEDQVDWADIIPLETQAHVVTCLQTALAEMHAARDPLGVVPGAAQLQ